MRHWVAVKILALGFRIIQLANWIIGDKPYSMVVMYNTWMFSVGGDGEMKFQSNKGKTLKEKRT